MKKKSARSDRSENAGVCDGSPPYPTPPAETGDIPGEGVLNFIYYGQHDIAKAFNDGQFLQHTMVLESGAQAYVFSLRGGPHKRRTLGKLKIKALLGPCTVVIQGSATKVLPTNGSMDIPAGSTFSFTASDIAVLQGRSLTGPGLVFPAGGGDDP